MLDQIMTPYPNTEIRQEFLAGGLITNAYDYKWYNGYWPQVRTRHLSSKELLFTRCKAKREVIGVWFADGEFRRNFPAGAGSGTTCFATSSSSTSAGCFGCTEKKDDSSGRCGSGLDSTTTSATS